MLILIVIRKGHNNLAKRFCNTLGLFCNFETFTNFEPSSLEFRVTFRNFIRYGKEFS